MENKNTFPYNRDLFINNTNTRLKKTLLNRIEDKFGFDLQQHMQNDPVHATVLKFESFVEMVSLLAIHELADRQANRVLDSVTAHKLSKDLVSVGLLIFSGQLDGEDLEPFKANGFSGPFVADVHTLIGVINELHAEEVDKLRVVTELFGDKCLVAKEEDVEVTEISVDGEALKKIIKGGKADHNG